MPKLIIHTAQMRYDGPDKLNITVGSATGLGRTFAPTWDMVRKYSAKIITEAQYEERYREMMKSSFRARPEAWQQLMDKGEVTLCCYCRASAFCHRHILADMLKDYAASVGYQVVMAGERNL